MANYRTLENDLIEKLNQRALLLEDSNKLSKLKHNIAKNKFLQQCKQKHSTGVEKDNHVWLRSYYLDKLVSLNVLDLFPMGGGEGGSKIIIMLDFA